MNEWVETYRGMVEPEDCDFNHHMNVKSYFSLFYNAAGYLTSLAGIYHGDVLAQGVAVATIANLFRYYDEAKHGDRFVIEGAILTLGHTSIRYGLKMILARTAKTCATAEFTDVLFDVTTRKSTPWTPAMRRSAEPFVVQLNDDDRALFPAP